MEVDEKVRNENKDSDWQEETDFQPTSVELLKKLGDDYADFLTIDTSIERKTYGDTVDEMLTKLDEFCGLVDMIRSDTALCLSRTVPEIQEKCGEMHQIFTKVDRLEAFVMMVKQNVSLLEEEVNRAEDEMGSLSGIRKMLSSISIPSFMSPKKTSKQKVDKPERSLIFDPPEIFITEKYFTSSVEEDSVQDKVADSKNGGEPT